MKRRNLTPNRAAATVLAFAMASLLVACDALETGLEPHHQLDCDPDALQGTFLRQSEGVFTLEDLASRSDDPGERREFLQDIGFTGGVMSTWRRSEPSVPVQRQVDLVCQATHFADTDGARAFLDHLAADETVLREALMAWPPHDSEPVSIETITDSADERGYVVHPGDPDAAGLRIMFLREGSTVMAVQLGTIGAVPGDEGLGTVLRSFHLPDED